MESYRYRAMNEQGRVIVGRLDASNIGDLEARLSRLGLDLVSWRELGTRGKRISGRSIRRVDLITFCFHLEQLMRAGVPIIEGLSDLRDSLDNPRLKEVTAALIEGIEGGKNLSEAMGDFPNVFSKVFVGLIRAGEQSGRLPLVLRDIAENLKWQDEQAAYAQRLFMYPALVGAVVFGVFVFLMTYLVPELLRFVQTMGQHLPWHTRALIAVSDVVRSYWYLFFGVPLAVGLALMLGVRQSPEFRRRIDEWKLELPFVGPILKKIILTRFTNYFAMMYSSGITVLDCIRASEDIVGNRAIEEAVRSAGRQIADGAGISTSFESSRLFPPLVIRMLRVGENTGALEESLRNVSYFYTRDVRESVERLQALIGPAMTVVLGLVLGWVMLSILGPIYELISKIKV